VKQITTLCVVVSLLLAFAPYVRAQALYEVELVVQKGKKSKETDSVLRFDESTVDVTPDKKKFKSSAKTFNYKDIKRADYSHAKKPMLSVGGAVATTLLVGFIFALPFMFIKKKKHWMAIETEKEFAIIKMKKSNYRPILAEFKTHGVNVTTVEEEKKKKDKE